MLGRYDSGGRNCDLALGAVGESFYCWPWPPDNPNRLEGGGASDCWNTHCAGFDLDGRSSFEHYS